MKRFLLLLALVAGAAHADAVDALREFTRDVKSGRTTFTQVVTSAQPSDNAKKKTSSGTFEFARPNRFRFAYAKPYEQVIVGDGQSVWLYDVDLQQVTVRAMDQALGATPAALLAGANVEKDFELKAQPSAQGLDWVQATPRTTGEAAGFQSLRVGFKGKALSAIELVDNFGQRSLLTFGDIAVNTTPTADTFRFTPPKGVEVLRQ